MQLFYNPEITPELQHFFFDKEESKHIVKVLRKSTGDKLFVTNGLGSVFHCEILHASEAKCEVKVVTHQVAESKSYRIHLAVAPTKANDRFEWFLEKATEIGIDEITPIFCEHSERKHFNRDRMEKIIISAMKQSQQYFLPILGGPMSFKDFLKRPLTGQLFIAHCEESEKKSLKSQLKPSQSATILIGPEGDFSVSEIKLAVERGFSPVTLGDSRLRTETAAIVACHTVNLMNES